MKMKRLFCLFLSVCLLLALAACGEKAEDPSTEASTEATVAGDVIDDAGKPFRKVQILRADFVTITGELD